MDGVVHVFDLEGHPSSKTGYAWSSPVEGSENRKFYAVLHVPPVDSPEAGCKGSHRGRVPGRRRRSWLSKLRASCRAGAGLTDIVVHGPHLRGLP